MGTFDDLMAQDAPRKAVGKEKGTLAAQGGVGGAGAAALGETFGRPRSEDEGVY